MFPLFQSVGTHTPVSVCLTPQTEIFHFVADRGIELKNTELHNFRIFLCSISNYNSGSKGVITIFIVHLWTL